MQGALNVTRELEKAVAGAEGTRAARDIAVQGVRKRSEGKWKEAPTQISMMRFKQHW